MKVTLNEIIDLGMRVNKHSSNELVDLLIFRFKTSDGEIIDTYPIPKTCHASSSTGKFIRALLGRNIDKDDYTEDYFNASALIGKSINVEIQGDKAIKVI